MPEPTAKPLSLLDRIKQTMLDNVRANNADPEGRLAWELERNQHARPFPMNSPIPKPPALNPDGSEKQEEESAADVQESADLHESEETWLVVPDDVLGLLMESADADEEEGEDLFEKSEQPGFTGIMTFKNGAKHKFLNGKPVAMEKQKDGKKTFRARLHGEKVHVLSHDVENGLASVKGQDGSVQVVAIEDLDLNRGQGKPAQKPKPADKTLAQEPATVYAPDPTSINPATGLADKARVGVPAMSVPPPPAEIGRLPNLDKKQRKAESRFAEEYLQDPDGMADKYLQALKDRKVGEYPNVFATDDVKMLNPDWNPAGAGNLSEGLPDKVKKAMAQNNAAVHQTANAIAKRAFVKYLDDVVKKLPEGKRSVLVTQGGCASGKGSSLKRATDPNDAHFGMLPAADQVGAIWDAAGEQDATENQWVLEECQKRNIKPIFAYVYADPTQSWGGSDSRGVIRRAIRKGRMVDARLFADSYAIGAKNMKAFVDKHKDAEFIFLDNRDKKKPKLLDRFPEETLKWDAESIYRDAVKVLEQRRDELTPAIMDGGLGGTKIWGPPKAALREGAEPSLLEAAAGPGTPPTAKSAGGSGFTGTDAHGHKWQAGEQVAIDKETPGAKQTAKLYGKPVEVVSRDSTHGLVRVKGEDGDKVVSAKDLGDGGGEAKPQAAPAPAQPKVPAKKFGKSKAEVSVRMDEENVDANLAKLFPDLDAATARQTIADVVGAPDGAQVFLFGDGIELKVSIKHKGITRCDRTIWMNAAGQKFIHNDYLSIAAPGSGLGTAILARQVENAAANGFASIHTTAGGSWESLDAAGNFLKGKMGGYYFWPKVGYDASIENIDFGPRKLKEFRAKFPDAKTIRDVIDTKQGMKWWKFHGEQIEAMEFDLSEGSVSRRMLAEYIEKESQRKNLHESRESDKMPEEPKNDEAEKQVGDQPDFSKEEQESLDAAFFEVMAQEKAKNKKD